MKNCSWWYKNNVRDGLDRWERLVLFKTSSKASIMFRRFSTFLQNITKKRFSLHYNNNHRNQSQYFLLTFLFLISFLIIVLLNCRRRRIVDRNFCILIIESMSQWTNSSVLRGKMFLTIWPHYGFLSLLYQMLHISCIFSPHYSSFMSW